MFLNEPLQAEGSLGERRGVPVSEGFRDGGLISKRLRLISGHVGGS